jgi:hypothetical protein
MIKNLPSKRYEIFQTLFEKHVTLIQEQVRRVEAMREIYTIASEVMASLDMPNDHKENFGAGYVTITVQATPDDRLSVFEGIVEIIGERLKTAGLHPTGKVLMDVGGHWHDIECRWWCGASNNRASKMLKIVFECPKEGLRDLQWVTSERVVTTTEYKGVPREEKTYGHSTLRVVGADDIAQGLAELL